jgi:AraC-like DNA-binding protein
VPDQLKPQSSIDVLGDILETLRFKGSIFFRSDLAAPWGMSLTEMGFPRFHIVLSGECYVGSSDQPAIKASEMDIIMLPNGVSHWIADQPGRKMVPSARAGKACELGNPLFQSGNITNRLMCGMAQFDEQVSHPILTALPDLMHFAIHDSQGSIWTLVNLIDTEMAGRPGEASLIADRLTEVLFLQLLDYHVRHNENATGFLAALRDRRICHALTLIHREPEFDWTLETLGARVGMSRATLVRHFQEAVGVSPMAYVKDWRIMKAQYLVKHSAKTVEQIAESTGFASARTLSKSFKRAYGCTPNEMRR